MIPEGIPRELAHKPMVLVRIALPVGENQVRIDTRFDFLKEVLHRPAFIWQIAVPELLQVNFTFAAIREQLSSPPRLRLTCPNGAQHGPAESWFRVASAQLQQGRAAANL